MAVDRRRLEGGQAVGLQDLPGEGGRVLLIDVLQRHDRVRFHELAQLQRVDIHKLRNVADSDGGVQLGVIFVAALHDPVVLDDDVQLVAVQIAPEVVFHGLVREIGKEVSVQGIIRAADEVDLDGLRVLLESRFTQAARRRQAERQHQGQKS